MNDKQKQPAARPIFRWLAALNIPVFVVMAGVCMFGILDGKLNIFNGQNALLREQCKAANIKFHDAEMEKAFWEHTTIKNFADAYPTGERLERLLAMPPHMRD